MQAATGGLSSLTAVVLMLEFVIARLATSTRYSAEIVLTSVAIAGGLVGGFVLVPFINGLVPGEAASEDHEYQREDSF
jgi:hypothetical protein